MRTRGRFLLGALLIGLLASTAQLRGDNGSVLNIADVLRGKKLVDITQDLRNGSYWVLRANDQLTDSHILMHVSADLSTLEGSILNPHPIGTFPNLTVNLGIAYRSISRTLFVLSRRDGAIRVAETNPDSFDDAGFDGLEFVVTPPDAGATLFGLSYDQLEQEFWTLDTANDKALRFGLDGTVTAQFPVPGKTSPSTVIRGRGVAYELDVVNLTATPFVYVPYGDIFRREPSRLVRVGTESGLSSGLEVPLTAIPSSGLAGFHVTRIGLQRRMLMTADDGLIYQLEIVLSVPPPPGQLACSLTTANQVFLSWENHGSGDGGAYGGSIQVLRNDVAFATLPGDATSFTDTTPVEGTSTYALRASSIADGPLSASSSPCEVTVGSGGLIRFAMSSGSAVFDLTRNPQTGDVFVTDNLAGAIRVFNSDLEQQADLAASPWTDPGGIAFVPDITLGFPPSSFTSLLAVARTSGKQLRFIDLGGNEVTTITLALPGSTSQIAGLSFIPSSRRFVAIDRAGASPRIHVLEANGNLVQSCAPPAVPVEFPDFEFGVTFDPLRGTVLVAYEDGSIGELFIAPGSCPANTIDFDPFSLAGLGEAITAAGGLQIAGNTLLVAGPSTNAIYQVLISPFESPFVRGDFDDSGAVNISDAIGVAEYLFRDGPAPACLDAADANDDGILDVGDPVYLVFFLFLGTAAPPPPFPAPGQDPTFRDTIGCAK